MLSHKISSLTLSKRSGIASISFIAFFAVLLIVLGFYANALTGCVSCHDIHMGSAKVSGTSVTLSADKPEGTTVLGVQFKLDGSTNIGAEDTATPYSGTWDSTTVADGAHTITAIARDGANSLTTIGVTSVVVDNTAPTAAITYSTTASVKSGDSLVITATFSEDMSDSPTPKIAISGANTLTATGMTKVSSTVYAYTYTVGSGSGTATVALSTGTDLAGNGATSTPRSGGSFTVTNTVSGAPATRYIPGAVTFNPETMLGVVGSTLGANGGVDTSHFIASFWLRSSIGSSTNTGNDALWSSWLLDIWTNLSNGPCNSETCPGLDFVTDNAGAFGTMRLNINDATGGTNHSFQGVMNNFFQSKNATWHHWLWVADTGYAKGSKRQALYLDGVKQSISSSTEVGTVGAFNIALNSALGFALNGHTNSGINSGAFDISDFVLDTHTTSISGCSSVIDSTNTVCPGIVSAFYNAGPVALGTNCTNPLGTQPELCFSGDKTTFAQNKGNATATMTLSNPIVGSLMTPSISNASYPPANAPTDRPYFNWVAANHLTGMTTTTSSMPTNNRGNPIAAGDLILLSVGLGDSSGTTDRAIQTPAGFTLLPTSTTAFPFHTVSGTHPINTAVFYKVAQASDITAAGSDWASSPIINWTANGTALRWASYTMLNYGNANTATPIQVADAAYKTNTSTSSVAPSVSVSSAPATLVTLNTFWSCTPVTSIDGTEDLRFRRMQSAGCAFGYTEVGDQPVAATGATGIRTTTQSTAESSMAVNVVVQP